MRWLRFRLTPSVSHETVYERRWDGHLAIVEIDDGVR
jgi:hypothetical protein